MFDRDVKTIGKHINNALQEELIDQVVVAKFATTTPHGAVPGKTQTHQTQYYNLDVIISVGYRVKSQRGVEFRQWANKVLKQYILQGYAVNQKRLEYLNKTVEIESKIIAHMAEISTGMKLSELKILNNIIPLEIATDREVNACEEYFKSNGSYFSDFYVSLLMNEENLEKTRLTIKETANRGSVYLRYYYPCELFYKMNKKKEEK